ncbi:MAG TPA: carbon storage regulator CsrA [Phycisphaerales bacterium]|nr:carbon storage regulator CsrA [Phycisphaerales bacterium]
MLVLSRQRDETIMIGDDIELTVVDIRGDKVRIGIKAPPHVPVHRKEVYDAIRRENEQAARFNVNELGMIKADVPARPSRPHPAAQKLGSQSNASRRKKESA